MDKEKTPLVTVGVPIFNGEKVIKRRLESIINQTYKNIEVVISDNASTDNTEKLCQEFLTEVRKKEYFKQKKNLGYIANFNYLIKKARGKYFVIAAVDDVWEEDFLEKNVNMLESNEKIIGSIGKIEYFKDEGKVEYKSSKVIQKLKKIIRKQNVNVSEKHVMSVSGDTNQKIDKYLRFNQGSFVYGLFRTHVIQKNIILGPLAVWDLAFILNILKYGDLQVIDKVLLHKYVGGLSSKGIIHAYRRHEIPFFDLVIPNFSFFRWALKNMGTSFCVRNLDWFILLTIYGWYVILKKF